MIWNILLKDIYFLKNYNYKSNFKIKIKNNICEFKYNNLREGILHEDNVPFTQTRFSKYSESIKNLY